MPLATGATDVVQPPLHRPIVVLNNESVLGNANRLDPRVKHIVDGRHISFFSDPRDLIKETKGNEGGLALCNESRPPASTRLKGEEQKGVEPGTERTIQTILPDGSSSFPTV